MLKAFLERNHRLPIADTIRFPEYFKLSLDVFSENISLLKEYETTPSKRINELIDDFLFLTGSQKVPLIFDQWNIPSFSLSFLQDGEIVKPVFILPFNFVDTSRTDAISTLSSIVSAASKGRDCIREYSEEGMRSEYRAKAYEAEFLLAIAKKATEENFEIRFDPYQNILLEEFPTGIPDFLLDNSTLKY